MKNYLITGKRILVVDDNHLSREIALEVLSAYGVKVEFAISGENAIQLIKRRKENDELYDIILLDISLIGINGYQTADKIREIPGYEKDKVKIVGLSASPVNEELAKSFNAYCRKPLSIKELSSVL